MLVNTLRSSQTILGYFLVCLVAVAFVACASEPPTPTPEPTPTPTPIPTLTSTPESVTFHNYMGDCYNLRVEDFELIASEWGTVLVSDVDDLGDGFLECVIDAVARDETQANCFANFNQDIRDAATYGNADAQTVTRAKAKLRQCVAK